MEALFSTTPSLMAIITLMIAVAFYLQKSKIFKNLAEV